MDDRQLHALRREARALLRAATSGDTVARERAAVVLRGRAERRFVLADALHVVARERGAPSWPALVARARSGAIRSALEDVTDNDGNAEVEVETELRYPDGAPVVIVVRRRQRRLLLHDRGEAVTRSGRPQGWAEAAERAVRRSGMNVSPTTGAVFVPASGGRDLDDLALRLARSSLDVLEALVDLDERG
jgi:hypothetical protein